jgi:hypothetical protein
MKNLFVLSWIAFFMSSTLVFSQENIPNANPIPTPNPKRLYFGIDMGRGRTPLFIQSFEGTMFHYPDDPSAKNLWASPFQPEGRPNPSFSGKFGMFLSKPASDIQILGELGIECFSIGYTNKDYSTYYSYGYYVALYEFNYTLSSINLIPKIQVSGRITNSLHGYMGFGAGLALLKLHEKENCWMYDESLRLEWSYAFDEKSHVTKLALNPFIGAEWKLNKKVGVYVEYDYLYVPELKFEFDEVSKSGKVKNNMGSIDWKVTSGKRERYFKIPSTNLKFGFGFYL